MDTLIDVENLEVGMYVKLRGNWVSQEGIEREFFISSREQLESIRANASKYGKVYVDHGKSSIHKEVEYYVTHIRDNPVSVANSQELTQRIQDAAQDPSMQPDKKARAVYDHSLQLMQILFDSPTAEHIVNTKEAVSHVVDLVLQDDETAVSLLKVTSHDFYTYTHSVNVGILSIALAKRLYQGSKQHNMHELGAGFFLHDLGKVHVDRAILNKPAKLTEGEMRQMRTHPFQSYKILFKTSQLTQECRLIAMQHHEREDGTGYPKRLKGSEIHDYGKICCIADVYDAITAKRSYKPAMPPFKALTIMKEEMLNHFQKDLFRNFVMLFQNK